MERVAARLLCTQIPSHRSVRMLVGQNWTWFCYSVPRQENQETNSEVSILLFQSISNRDSFEISEVPHHLGSIGTVSVDRDEGRGPRGSTQLYVKSRGAATVDCNACIAQQSFYRQYDDKKAFSLASKWDLNILSK